MMMMLPYTVFFRYVYTCRMLIQNWNHGMHVLCILVRTSVRAVEVWVVHWWGLLGGSCGGCIKASC